MAWSRRYLLVAVLVVFAPTPAEAQTPPPPTAGFRVLGVHGAVTAAILAGGGEETSWGPGFFAGLFYTPKPDVITWHVEGMFHIKGGKFNGSTVRITQVEVPVMLRINLRADRRTKFHLLAGPSIAYQWSGKLNADNGEADFTGTLRMFEAGLVLGGGVDVGRAVVGARFMQGLQTTRIVINEQETRNRVIAMVLGYKF